MKLVLRLGGHALFKNNGGMDTTLIKEYAKNALQLREEGHILHIVIGGGTIARSYISALSELGASNALKDYMGMLVTRANALVLIAALKGYAYSPVPTSYEGLLEALSSGKIVVCGGLQPGQSTLAVAAILAETINADYLLNATDVDGVYTSDPKRDPKARLLREVTIRELRSFLRRGTLPGTYPLFDDLALNIIERSRIKTIVFNGRRPENMLRIAHGERVGTLIKP